MLIRNNGQALLFFLNSIKWDILFITIYAIVASLWDHTSLSMSLVIPLPVAATIATILSLLLAFRTGQSYERWWEARKVWGEIVNDSRTFIRQLKQFLPENSKEDLLMFAETQIVWCFALSESLRRQSFSVKVEEYLKQNNIQTNNVPCYLLNMQADHLAKCSSIYNLNVNKQVQIDTTLASLNAAMGKCERIKNTVFPKSYSLFIHFLIYVFATILPFGLADVTILLEIFITILLPFLFIAIEKTAIIMQDPFENIPTDIPMTALCNTIESNINEMLNHSAAPKKTISNSYYIN